MPSQKRFQFRTRFENKSLLKYIEDFIKEDSHLTAAERNNFSLLNFGLKDLEGLHRAGSLKAVKTEKQVFQINLNLLAGVSNKLKFIGR